MVSPVLFLFFSCWLASAGLAYRSEDEIDFVGLLEVRMEVRNVTDERIGEFDIAIVGYIVPDKLYELHPLEARIARRVSRIECSHEHGRREEFRMHTTILAE